MVASVHAIASKLSPLQPCSGIQSIDCAAFSLLCLQCPTGLKIILQVSSLANDPADRVKAEGLLRKAYGVYADWAMKNPFQQLDMPIRSDLFDQQLLRALN